MHFRCAVIFLCIGSFQNFKTFHVKLFFFFKGNPQIFVPRVALDLEGVVYILLYGFIYYYFFLLFQSAGRFFFFFFAKCRFGFIHPFPPLPALKYICCCHFKHWRPENYFSPFGALGSLANRRTAGKTGLKGWYLSVCCSKD